MDLRLAVVGLGHMGLPMATHLVRGGYRVAGYDVSEAARESFAHDGGTPHSDLSEAIAGSDVVLLSLPNSRIVESVVHEILPDLAAGTVVVDMSSSEPTSTTKLAAELDERRATLVDAPVSGGVIRAKDGTLTIMVGGDAAVIVRLEPIFALLGTAQRAGDVGAGHAAKALNNLMSATHLLISAEAIETGERFGIEPEVLVELVNTSSGRSGSTQTKYPKHILPGTYDSGFSLALLLKDMRIATALGHELGSDVSLGDAAAALWAKAAEELPETADHTEIARWVHDRTNR
nr:NAD(P)-dependent oxidoreductase [Brachybacterium sp. ACRRE]